MSEGSGAIGPSVVRPPDAPTRPRDVGMRTTRRDVHSQGTRARPPDVRMRPRDVRTRTTPRDVHPLRGCARPRRAPEVTRPADLHPRDGALRIGRGGARPPPIAGRPNRPASRPRPPDVVRADWMLVRADLII